MQYGVPDAPQRCGLRGYQALAGAIRYTAPFNDFAIENAVLLDVSFLQLPDVVQCFGSVRALNTVFISPTPARTGFAGAPRVFNVSDMMRAVLFYGRANYDPLGYFHPIRYRGPEGCI